MEEYNYGPLSVDSKEIRLVEILPGSRGSQCYCSISKRSLTQVRKAYVALSYAWGSEENKRDIHVINPDGQDQTLAVTRNLYCALDHIRDQQQSKLMWIDAICIDQRNIQERNSQVRFMKDIYRAATHVLAWLGPACHNSDLIFDVFSRHINRETQAIFFDNVDDNTAETVSEIDTVTKKAYILAIDSLLRRPWFSRIWIRQEVWASRGMCLLKCGKREVTLRNFYVGCNKILPEEWGKQTSFSSIDDYVRFQEISAMVFLLCILPFEKPHGHYISSSLLALIPGTQASDPRDFIFAILGIFDWANDLSSLINYSKDVVEVFCEMTKEAIQQDHSLFLLESRETWVFAATLPSWTIDWRTARDGVSHIVLPASVYNASLGSKVKVQSGGENMRLTLAGVSVSKIDYVDQAKGLDNKSIISFAEEFLGNPHRESYARVAQIFWRTILVDTALDGKQWISEKRRISKNFKWQELQSVMTEHPDALPKLVYLRHRVLCISSQRRLVLANERVEEGDEICIFSGGRIPFIIRPTTSEEGKGPKHFQLICSAYVPGIMDGEAWDDTKLRNFTLV